MYYTVGGQIIIISSKLSSIWNLNKNVVENTFRTSPILLQKYCYAF